VARAMQGYGYKIIPVRPGVDEILGEPAVADLADLDEAVDIVDVFRAPEHVDGIVDTCIENGLKVLWLQEGVVNEAAAERARQAGMFVVMDRCIYKEYAALVDGEAD
ncbi:MAG: CoA-binding protein, partial [Gammaproteobacteria bacterium]